MNGAVRSAGGQYTIEYAPLSDASVYRETQPRVDEVGLDTALPRGSGGLAQFQNFPPLVAGAAIPEYRSAAHLGGFYHVVKTMTVQDNPAATDTAFHYQDQFFTRTASSTLAAAAGWVCQCPDGPRPDQSAIAAKRTVNSYAAVRIRPRTAAPAAAPDFRYREAHQLDNL